MPATNRRALTGDRRPGESPYEWLNRDALESSIKQFEEEIRGADVRLKEDLTPATRARFITERFLALRVGPPNKVDRKKLLSIVRPATARDLNETKLKHRIWYLRSLIRDVVASGWATHGLCRRLEARRRREMFVEGGVPIYLWEGEVDPLVDQTKRLFTSLAELGAQDDDDQLLELLLTLRPAKNQERPDISALNRSAAPFDVMISAIMSKHAEMTRLCEPPSGATERLKDAPELVVPVILAAIPSEAQIESITLAGMKCLCLLEAFCDLAGIGY